MALQFIKKKKRPSYDEIGESDKQTEKNTC